VTLSHSDLLDLLEYEPDTGRFCWRVDRSNGVKAGQETGRVDSRGYLQVCVLGRRYLAHRLAWFYAHAEWPPEEIDHINHDRLDNRMANLRVVSRAVNARNRPVPPNQRSGVAGVRWHKATGKWAATVGNKHLGLFTTVPDAAAVRVRALALAGYHPNHGSV
jgi:hypothetical protein